MIFNHLKYNLGNTLMTPPFLKSCLKAPPLTSRLQKKQELVISFLKTANNFLSLNINSGQLEVVTNA